MGLAKQETCWKRKNDLNTCKRWHTDTDKTFTFTVASWNDSTGLQIDRWLCLIGMLQARLEIRNLEGLSTSLAKILYQMTNYIKYQMT